MKKISKFHRKKKAAKVKENMPFDTSFFFCATNKKMQLQHA